MGPHLQALKERWKWARRDSTFWMSIALAAAMIISKLYGNYILTIILGLATLSMLAYGEKKRQMEMGCDHTWTVEESLKAAGKKSSMDDAFCELQRCNKCGDKRGVIITINGHDEVCVGWVKRQIANTTDNASKE